MKSNVFRQSQPRKRGRVDWGELRSLKPIYGEYMANLARSILISAVYLYSCNPPGHHARSPLSRPP